MSTHHFQLREDKKHYTRKKWYSVWSDDLFMLMHLLHVDGYYGDFVQQMCMVPYNF